MVLSPVPKMALVLPFEKLHHMRAEHEKLIFGYARYFDIPNEIANVILLFCFNVLNSSILTSKEENMLFEVLHETNKLSQFKNFSTKLIYHPRKHGLTESSFKDKCHYKRNLLCLVITKNGEIYGGFTSVGWKGRVGGHTLYDSKAFVFSITRKQRTKITIYDIVNPNDALSVKYQYYCMFGVNDTAYKDTNENYASLSIKYYYEYTRYHRDESNECYWKDDNLDEVVDIEVYQFNR